MKFYSYKYQWIIGLDQGTVFNEAIILEERPLPVRKWESKKLKK